MEKPLRQSKRTKVVAQIEHPLPSKDPNQQAATSKGASSEPAPTMSDTAAHPLPHAPVTNTSTATTGSNHPTDNQAPEKSPEKRISDGNPGPLSSSVLPPTQEVPDAPPANPKSPPALSDLNHEDSQTDSTRQNQSEPTQKDGPTDQANPTPPTQPPSDMQFAQSDPALSVRPEDQPAKPSEPPVPPKPQPLLLKYQDELQPILDQFKGAKRKFREFETAATAIRALLSRRLEGLKDGTESRVTYPDTLKSGLTFKNSTNCSLSQWVDSLESCGEVSSL